MTISFYLKSSKEDLRTIYVQFYAAPERHTFATRYKVQLKDWDAGQPKKTNATVKLRQDLVDFETAANDFINALAKSQHRQPTKAELKMFINKAKGVSNFTKEDGQLVEIDNKLYLTDLFQQYQEREFKKLSESTQGICLYTMKLVNEFAPNAQAYDINHKWGEQFHTFLTEQKAMQIGTANKYVKKLTTILNWCFKKELVDKDFTKYLEKAAYREPEIIVVDQDELHQVETSTHTNGKHIELPKHLENTRQIFIFACYIGQRYEDVIAINKQNLVGNQLRVKQQKTGQVVFIPLLPEAQMILDKYNWSLPAISNQKANENLREVFTALGMNRIVHDVRRQGQGEKLFNLPLHEVIHFHSARATFCTIGLSVGIPETVIRQVSGHKSVKNFQRYVRFSQSQLENQLAKMSRSSRSLSVSRTA